MNLKHLLSIPFLYLSGTTHALATKVNIGMTNALIIIIFPRIVKFRFPQEKNKVFILSILFSQFNDETTHSIKISRLADDTTLFCTSKEEIYIALNEIETFGSFSGLLMNKNKTGGIWVGKLKHSKDKIEGIKWYEKPFKTLTSNKSKYRYD
jgi:hypothetical protein